MIVVLDSNVIVSALQFGSRISSPVLALAKATKQDRVAASSEMRNEVFRILVEKFDWSIAEAEEALQPIFRQAIRVNLRGTVHLCRDPADDMVLECAERAHADLIVTGDKDLLALTRHGRTSIVTPAEYLLL